ncbi:hypothetical protein DPMN_098284 [Dreissena polymorpha]|uniref:Uncharacterized protein n=1 Tax=Dreissena polymorpha TaxID=45954 RepID=A0A9D4LDA5_DREPO|nr:hypothetical protein DPMN_098284 [Dreissena polymorpha]
MLDDTHGKWPAPWRPCFKCHNHFELSLAIIRTNALNTFYKNGQNVTSRVLTRFHYSKIWKENARLPGGHLNTYLTINGLNLTSTETCPASRRPYFQWTGTIFDLIQDITYTDVLTKFHEQLTINVTCRAKTAPHPESHILQPIGSIFEHS